MNKIKDPLETVPSSSLLVYPKSGIIRLFCPIKVACIQESPPISEDDIVFVEGISYTRKSPLLYLIRGKLHPFQNFIIIKQEPIQ
jgi:hypothetical protein